MFGRPSPATVGRARPAAETVELAGRTGGPPGLAGSSALREGLNEPGPGPFGGPFRPTAGDRVFCKERRSSLAISYLSAGDNRAVAPQSTVEMPSQPKNNPRRTWSDLILGKMAKLGVAIRAKTLSMRLPLGPRSPREDRRHRLAKRPLRYVGAEISAPSSPWEVRSSGPCRDGRIVPSSTVRAF